MLLNSFHVVSICKGIMLSDKNATKVLLVFNKNQQNYNMLASSSLGGCFSYIEPAFAVLVLLSYDSFYDIYLMVYYFICDTKMSKSLGLPSLSNTFFNILLRITVTLACDSPVRILISSGLKCRRTRIHT